MSIPEFDSTILYAPIPEINGKRFPWYYVGSDGTVWTQKRPGSGPGLKPWRQLKPSNLDGYRQVALYSPDKTIHQFKVHFLVLTAFVGPRPDGMQARHFPDRTRSNNNLSNLQWGTPQENSDDREIHGTTSRGETAGTSKLTENDVLEIRCRIANGERQIDLAAVFNVTQVQISVICRGESWSHVGGERTLTGKAKGEKKSKLTNQNIALIREQYAAGLFTLAELCKQYDVTPSNISAIIRRKSWKHI